MKRLLIALCLLLIPSVVSAAESVRSFDVVVDVLADSSLRVTETVVYDMDGVQRHGWERIIPKQSEDGPSLVFTGFSAYRAGEEDPFSVSQDGDQAVVRIGDSERTISGVHTYVLSYTVYNGVRYFNGYDEVYWNAIPQGLRLPVQASSVLVNIPDGASVTNGPYCYTGPAGSEEAACDMSAQGTEVYARALGQFAPGEGLTITVGIMPGAITRVPPVEDSYASGIMRFFDASLGFVMFGVFAAIAIGIIFLLVALSRSGGLPRRRSDGGDIVAQYDPPDGCSAPDAAYLSHATKSGLIFTAGVVQLAVLGWLSMTFEHTKGFLGSKKTEITFKKKREGHPDDPTLHQIMDTLFMVGPERTLSELKKHAKEGAVPATSIAAGVPLILERRGWLERGMFGLYHRASAAGRPVKEHLAGLKLYIGAAEKERLEFHNAPAHSPQTFEKLLPYAIALGVDEPWTKSFGDLQYTPEWAAGDVSMIGTVALADSIGDLSSGVQSVMNAYSSGVSGGGGGGSSGGGGGGGGGGGW